MLRKLQQRKHLKMHGFLARMATKNGRNIIARRRAKNRTVLTVGDKK